MRGTGTFINVAAIVMGTAVGVAAGSRVSERARTTVLQGVGLVVAVLGIMQAQRTHNLVFPLVAVVTGGAVGEAARIEERLEGLGERIRRRIERGERHPLRPAIDPAPDEGAVTSRFAEGFVAATLVFVVGPLAILGSLADGLHGDNQLLVVKAALDGLAAIVFASTLGVGVGFSALPILVYQGGITLAARAVDAALDERMVLEMTATGGLLVMGLSLRLLDIKPVRVASFLPALAVAPALVAVFAR